MSDQRITNLSYLEELGMGDDELLIDMVEMFLKNTPESIEKLRKYHSNEDWKKLAAEAHKLKPNLSYVGLDGAREIIIGVEDSAKNQPEPDKIAEMIDEVDAICNEAYEELQVRLEELKK